MSNDLIVEQDADVLNISLNRPERLNALSPNMLEELTHTLGAVDRATTTAVIIRGAGRAFCSGHDLKEAAVIGRLTTVTARALVEQMQAVAIAMRDCPAPIVTCVHGYAIGGGAEIALSGDIVLVANDTTFQFTEAAVGRVVTNGFTSLLPKTVGPVRAKALFLLGRTLTGEQAEKWGVATEAVPIEDLEDSVAKTLETLRAQSRWAVAAGKNLINKGLEATFAASIEFEIGAAIEAELGDYAESAASSFANT